MLASIDESSADDNSDDKSISTDGIEDIWYGRQVNEKINARYARLKIRDHIRLSQNEWKGEEISTNNMGKGLHKLCQAVVNKLNN